MKAKRPESENEAASERYAAKLLFQFRVVVDGSDGIMRICEERIVVLRAETAREALRKAKRYGRLHTSRYRNTDGNPVHFEFVGVMDLLHLGTECDEHEVWYDIMVRKTPMERASALLPLEHRLYALREERKARGQHTGRTSGSAQAKD